MAARARTLKRLFYYYKAKGQYLPNSSNTMKNVDDISKVLKNVFKEIKELEYINGDYSNKSLLYQNDFDENIFIEIDKQDDSSIEFRLLLCRRSLLPFIEDNGELESLSIIMKEYQTLAEITHCIYFAESNIFAIEYNKSGAKAKDLASYIESKTKELDILDIVNLINIDTLKKIKEDKEISSFEFEALKGSKAISELIEADSAMKALNYNIEGLDKVCIKLTAKGTKSNPGFLLNFMNYSFVSKFMKSNKEDIRKFKVKYGYGAESVDLLSDKFVCKVDNGIVTENTKTMDKNMAYSKMREYYNQYVASYID